MFSDLPYQVCCKNICVNRPLLPIGKGKQNQILLYEMRNPFFLFRLKNVWFVQTKKQQYSFSPVDTCVLVKVSVFDGITNIPQR